MKKFLEKLYKNDKKSFFEILKKDLKNKNKKFIVTVNPETLMIAEKDLELKEILEDDSVSFVPDGIGVVKAAKMIGVDVKERIPGIEIAEKLFEFANESKKSLYLFGAKQEVLNNLKEKIEKNYSNIKLLGMTNGYVENKEEEFQKTIKKEPDIVLVALGIPAQEKLMYKYFKDFKKGIFVGVGGSFDVLSGTKKRAPQIFIKTNTEWLYRILKEPKRIKRFWANNVKFIFKIRKEKND
ncbi:MAG: WecB/TagA/CpsF family glycosyltransferase [Firmicutes bacterium]|jgi:glycosyltransferase, WecB/TagA/CpsF family|nr:WecB/TagA/CpsF family glycosyltransferase [Bacillota bacterium]